MNTKKSFIDKIEEGIDWIRFHIESAFEEIKEATADDVTSGKEKAATLFGRSILLASNILVPTYKEKVNPLVRVIKLLLTIILCLIAWLFITIILSITASLSAVLGLRKGKEYPWTENLFAWFPFLVVGFGLPFMGFTDFGLSQAILMFSYAIIVVGLNILVGIAGQHSLGHAAFVAIGGYTSALFFMGKILPFHIDPLFSLMLGGLISGVAGMLLALPAVQVRGPYLSLITLGLITSLEPLVKCSALRPYTNGVDGLSVDTPTPPFFLKFLSTSAWVYYISLFYFILLFVAAHVCMRRTKIGRAFLAIKDGEEKSNVLGINVPFYKMLSFAISAFYAGVGGGLITFATGFIAGNSFGKRQSLDYLVAMYIGGIGTFFGSCVGGIYVASQVFISDFLARNIQGGDRLIWGFSGMVLVLILILAPRGIAGEISHWFHERNFELPKRRLHKRNPFPDYDLDEELAAVAAEAKPEASTVRKPDATL